MKRSLTLKIEWDAEAASFDKMLDGIKWYLMKIKGITVTEISSNKPKQNHENADTEPHTEQEIG